MAAEGKSKHRENPNSAAAQRPRARSTGRGRTRTRSGMRPANNTRRTAAAATPAALRTAGTRAPAAAACRTRGRGTALCRAASAAPRRAGKRRPPTAAPRGTSAWPPALQRASTRTVAIGARSICSKPTGAAIRAAPRFAPAKTRPSEPRYVEFRHPSELVTPEVSAAGCVAAPVWRTSENAIQLADTQTTGQPEASQSIS